MPQIVVKVASGVTPTMPRTHGTNHHLRLERGEEIHTTTAQHDENPAIVVATETVPGAVARLEEGDQDFRGDRIRMRSSSEKST